MGFDFNNETPIYLQIVDYVKMRILNKNYPPNQKLPSVRELAFELAVNPNTVQKALSELENIGLIYTERTNGKYVTGDNAVIEKLKEETMQALLDNFLNSMKQIGLTNEEIFDFFNNQEGK